MPYKDPEKQKEYQREYQTPYKREYRGKQRAAQKLAKEMITALLRDIGAYDASKEDSTDGFVMLQNWLLPKFCDGLRFLANNMTEDLGKTGKPIEEVKRANYLVFDDMMLALQDGLADKAHVFPELLARGLSHLNGQFYLLAVCIRDLSDYVDLSDGFNEKQMLASAKAFVAVMKGSKLPGVSQPGFVALADRVVKEKDHGEWLSKQKMLEEKPIGTKTE
jgi:hypothetical protein